MRIVALCLLLLVSKVNAQPIVFEVPNQLDYYGATSVLTIVINEDNTIVLSYNEDSGLNLKELQLLIDLLKSLMLAMKE